MVFVYNAFVLAIMSVFAYKMDRWWIVLFAVLFMARRTYEVIQGDDDEE